MQLLDEVKYRLWEITIIFYYNVRYTLFPPRCAYLALDLMDEVLTMGPGRGSLE
jgi:hypothetical protein